MSIKLPLQPKYKKYDLTEAEKKAIRNVVVFGEDKKEMYKVFVRPDLTTAPAVLKKYSDDFYNRSETRDFIRDYTKMLEGVQAEEEQRAEPLSREQRKANAVESFTDKVIDKMTEGVDSVEELDAVAKLADRVGVLAEKENVVEQPRRYLPERCGECRYKKFIEENVKKGNIIDDENN